MAQHNERRHLHVVPTPRLTNAAMPIRKRKLTLNELLHGRRYAALREVIAIAVFVMCVMIVAYKWLATADPRLP